MSFRPCRQNVVLHPTVPLYFSSGSYRYVIEQPNPPRATWTEPVRTVPLDAPRYRVPSEVGHRRYRGPGGRAADAIARHSRDLDEQCAPVSLDTADRRFVHLVAVLSCSHSESTPP